MKPDTKTESMRNEAIKVMATRILSGETDPELSALEQELGVAAIVINDERGKANAPVLNELLVLAKNYAANYSELDYPVKDLKVVLVNNGNLSDLSNLYDHMVDKEKNLIVIPLSAITHQTFDQLAANTAHEYAHTGQHNPNGKDVTVRGNEALADRGAMSGLDALNAHLSYVALNADFYQHDEPNHPTLRSRIEMDLRRIYGDDVFKGHVDFDPKNNKLMPVEFNGMPITERGESVTNWKAEISPAIENQIAIDMQRLDKIVRDGGLQPTEHQQFLASVQTQATQLPAQHPPKTEINLDYHQHLADLFEKSTSNTEQMRSVVKLHPDMPKAYQAYINILDHSNNLPGGLKALVASQGVENITKNIAQGKFPDLEITSNALKQPPIEAHATSQTSEKDHAPQR